MRTINTVSMISTILFSLQRISTSEDQPTRTCVATDDGRHLCTDNPFHARAHRVSSKYGATSIGYYNGFETELDVGVEQLIDGTKEEQDAVKDVLMKMKYYFDYEVLARPEYAGVRGRCKNLDSLCAFWTSVGECETNRSFMLTHCAASCRLCLLLHSNLI